MLERLKTGAIFALLGLMGLLLVGNMTLGMDLFDREAGEAALPADNSWPLEPTLLAIGKGGQFYAPLTGEEWQLLLDQVSPLLTEAVGSMGTPEPLEAETAAQWLRGDCLLLGYEQPAALSALRYWSDAAAPQTDLQLQRILLRQEEGRVTAALYDPENACWYQAATAAGPQQLTALGDRFDRANGDLTGAEMGLAADCLVLRETGPLPVYAMIPPAYAASGELPRTVLAAFDMNGYLAKVYREEGSGDTVYVEDYSQVRITAGGDLLFTAAAGQGIPLEEDSDPAAARTIRALCARVWDLLGAGGTLTLAGVTEGEGGARLVTFDLLLEGRMVSASYGYAVSALVREGAIIQIRMSPRRLEQTGALDTALEFRYGALLSQPGASLSLCYMEAGSGLLRPQLRVED